MKKVITYGTFDLFHQGHYNLLKRAKELGDYLIVGVTTEHYDESRGKVNVIDSVLDRIENVRRTGFADKIIIEDHSGQKIEDIQKYKVDIFTVGSDWVGTFDYLREFCEVIYLERTPDISSTMLRKDRFKIVNLGIVGTGRIMPRFINESKYVSGVRIGRVYNPTGDICEDELLAEGKICRYSGEYSEFLDGIDAVYVASPNETHYEYVKKALEAGKHVLSEKPIAFTRKETVELYELAKNKKCILLEGIKTAYCPGFQEIINVVKSGKIGEVRDVEACFTRLANPNSRECTDNRYGGSYLEYGGYALLPIIKLLGTNYKEVSIDSILDDKKLDVYTKINMKFENGLATGKMGVGVKSEGQLVVAGTKGYILAESPWWLTKKFVIRYEDSSLIETYTPAFQGDGLRYEICEFVSAINGVSKNAYKLTPEESIAMAGITELFMEKRKELQSKTL